MRTPRDRLTSWLSSRLRVPLAAAALGGALAAQEGLRRDERFFREGLGRDDFGGDASALLAFDDGVGGAAVPDHAGLPQYALRAQG